MKERGTRRAQRKRARTMKFRGGQRFEGLRYISQGAQGATFLTSDRKLLKVIKRGEDASNEVYILKKLNELRIPYFPKFIAHGRGVSERSFNTETKWQTMTSVFNNTGPHVNDYILMEFIEGSKVIPKYFIDKIISMVPGLTRPLSIGEINTLKNQFINIFAKLGFAFYVADKVFNFRHKDFHENNCLIRENGEPVIIDMGGGKIWSNNTRPRRNLDSGIALRGYISLSLALGSYTPDIKPYIEQIKNHPDLQRLLTIPFRGRFAREENQLPLSIEHMVSVLESIETGEPEQEFDFMRTFSNLGIDKSMLARVGIKIKYRAPIARGLNTSNLEREEIIRGLIEGFAVPRETAVQALNAVDGDGDAAGVILSQYLTRL